MMAWLSKHVFFPLWEIKDGAHRRQYLRELSLSQWLDVEQIRRRQWQCVRAAVEYAFEHCPYYRARFAEAGFEGTLRDAEQLKKLPLLTKHDIGNHAEGLLSQQFDRSALIEAKTGGSTGHALTVYFDARCQEARNAAAMRSDRWAGWDIGSKVAAVWGNPPSADTLKKQLRNLLLDRVF